MEVLEKEIGEMFVKNEESKKAELERKVSLFEWVLT